MYRKEVLFDPELRDYACYLDGELVAFTKTYQEGINLLDQLVFDLSVGAYWKD